MTKSEFDNLCFACVNIARSGSPIDTGNLRFNAIRYEWLDERTFKIYVDENIAPYMLYTNEPWISERWKGKKNPNEAWWDNVAEQIASFIASTTKSEIRKS